MKATIYNASAGSGKTFTLAYEYIHHLIKCALNGNPTLYRNILAVTFTNKATEEMKSRILLRINQLANGEGAEGYRAKLRDDLKPATDEQITECAKIVRTKILHDYSRFTILTIDKFFQRILRAFIQELGIDIGYNLELDKTQIVKKAADTIIESITDSNNKDLHDWLNSIVQDRIDEGKKWDVSDAILSLSNDLLKEEARESIKNPIDKAKLKAMIDSRKKENQKIIKDLNNEAGKARQKIDKNCKDVDFKHSFTTIFTKFANLKSGDDLPEIGVRARSISDDTNPKEWGKSSAAQAIMGDLQKRLKAIIKICDDNTSLVNTYKLLNKNYRSFALLSDLFIVTERLCTEQNTKLLEATSTIIEELIGGVDAPFIYEKMGNRFSHFMIDEFQDTSQRDWGNFLPLLKNSMAESGPDENRIMIVGDIKQSIYRWRGGDWTLLNSKAKSDLLEGEHDKKTVVEKSLKSNFRSLPEVVNFNNMLIGNVMIAENNFVNKELGNIENSHPELYSELHNTIRKAYHGEGGIESEGKYIQLADKKKSGGYVEVLSCEKDQEPIIETIKAARDRGYRPCDILIVVRSKGDATKAAELLLNFKEENKKNPDAEEREKYDFEVMTQDALIVGSAPVSRFIAAVMHLAIDPRNTLQRAIYNKFRNTEAVCDFGAELSGEEQDFLRKLKMYSPIEAFEKIVTHYSLGKKNSYVAYLQTIHDQIIAFAANKSCDIKQFLEWWNEKGHDARLTVEQSEKAIEIMTIHKSKGLERKVVIIPYCNWERGPKSQSTIWAKEQGKNVPQSDFAKTSFPIGYVKNVAKSNFSEAYYRELVNAHLDCLNMLYVAVTRAGDSLHIFTNGTNIGEVVMEAMQSASNRFGAPTHNSGNKAKGGEKLKEYNSYQSMPQLHMPNKRYTKGGDDKTTIDRREFGIKMHKIFETATSKQDILEKAKQMLDNGDIDQAGYAILEAHLNKSLENPLAKEWFGGEWDMVRNESTIISATTKDVTRRPDRVMIKGDRAVVVDYKFGEEEHKTYSEQMQKYMKLLRDMGHTKVEGYIWYILKGESGEIVKVEQ